MPNENGRTLAGVVAELKGELKEFIQTRMEMLRAELKDKVKTWKAAMPALVIGILLLVTAWFLLTCALVAVIAAAFYPSPFALFFGFLIVGLVYVFGGAVGVIFALRSIRATGMAPTRTIKVLQEDKLWLQTEARTQV